MNDDERQVATSVLVIGTGGAGLRAAIELSERGVDVLAVGKRPKSDTHTYRRTAFAGDYTGLEIQRTLINRAAQLGVPILDTVYITRILVRDNVVFGAYGFDLEDGRRYVIHADAVILAAGGHTRIWRRTSSRRDENTGDSFRLAVLAGGRIRDAELVQFHPSGLIAPENAAGTLVSEAARGEGGVLRNALGERFMARYDPERMELSTRDRVALAAYTAAVLAARATLEAVLERRETRGCHNRADYPKLDESLRVNLVWSGPGQIEREGLPPVPGDIGALMREVSTVGRLVE